MMEELDHAMLETFQPAEKADPGILIEPNVWAALEEMGYTPEEIRAFYAEAAEDSPVEDVDPGHWEPTDLDGADWVLRRIREKDEAIALLSQPFDNEIRRLAERLEELKEDKARAVHQYERDRDFFFCRYNAALEEVTRHFLEDTCSKRKSISLPNGTLAFRRKQASVEVVDNDAAVVWAQDRGLVRTKVEVDKTAVKKYLAEHPDDDAEGMIYSEAYDEFKITSKGAE